MEGLRQAAGQAAHTSVLLASLYWMRERVAFETTKKRLLQPISLFFFCSTPSMVRCDCERGCSPQRCEQIRREV